MVEYGYMEGQYLRSRFIKPIQETKYDKDGNPYNEVITVEQQVAELSPEWKPVDIISDEAMQCDDESHIIVPVPYDAGDRISYRYEKRFDRQRIRAEIEGLKEALSGSDYKVAKCYEASLLNRELPYDIASLHTTRQAQRDKINELEKLLK